MPPPPRADGVNYFLLGSAAIICIFHLAVLDVAGGREGVGGGIAVKHFSLCLSTFRWEEKKKIIIKKICGSFHLGRF